MMQYMRLVQYFTGEEKDNHDEPKEIQKNKWGNVADFHVQKGLHDPNFESISEVMNPMSIFILFDTFKIGWSLFKLVQPIQKYVE